jgi:60 kDa SS-A/Ro ribonucleoprotein
LLPKMPMTALIRNLGNLSKVGILKAGNFDEIKLVVDKITSEENLCKARVHPLQLLMALKIYGAGHGMRGKGEWEVVPQIVDALDEAFYKAFAFVEPTGKRILIALDVSGSMTMGTVAGVEGLTPRAASAVMAMVTMKAEQNWAVVGFASGRRDSSHNWYMERAGVEGLTPRAASSAISTLNLSPRMRLDDVERTVDRLPFGRTDCALPAIWAKEQKMDFDAIFIYTDNETWAGNVQPVQAMRDYRNAVGHDVKLVVVGMTATNFSVADPEDASMMDVVGFDTNAPAIMSDFIIPVKENHVL